MTMAAAIAYYTVFSLPPLLLIVITLAGMFFDRSTVEQQLAAQMGTVIGSDAAERMRSMAGYASADSGGGWFAALIGIGALVFAATSAFAQLQAALNRAWEVKPDPQAGGLKNFVGKRVLSFGLILGIGFLLLVSLVLSAALNAFGHVLVSVMPEWVSHELLFVTNAGISFIIISLLFAAMFKVLPDAEIEWSDVWVGAAITTMLFVVGKFLVGFYIGQSGVAGQFGAAATLVIVLLWTYYSANIFLLGAEFTQVWATEHGKGIRPEEGAVRSVREEREEREPHPSRV